MFGYLLAGDAGAKISSSPSAPSVPWWTKMLAQLSRRFDTMYANAGRPSIPPEKRLRVAVAADAVADPQRAFADGIGTIS
jgi:hypothetical protein